MCKLQCPQISFSLHSVSVMYGNETPSADPSFSSSHQLNGLWKQGKWFSSDNRGCISLQHSSPFTIHPANGNNGIYHRRRHPQNNGNTGETMIDSNWILFRNPGQEEKRAEPDATGSRLSPKTALNTVIRDRWTSQRVYQHACMHTLILDRVSKQIERQAAGKGNTAVSAHKQTLKTLISGRTQW